MDNRKQSSELRTSLAAGQIVVLDKGCANSSEVSVVSQTPKRLLTTVSNGFYEWDVMTCRLTAKNN